MDNREGMAKLPPKSVDLIISDPPYYKIKGDFDFVFPSFQAYLNFMEIQAQHYSRILKDTGSLLLWGHAKRIAYIQTLFDQYFYLEAAPIWEKSDAQSRKSAHEMRGFAPVTERLLFYSKESDQPLHLYGVDKYPKLREYFRRVINLTGQTQAALKRKFGGCVDHVFRVDSSQWDLCSEQTYEKLKESYPIGLQNWYLRYDQLKNIYREYKEEYKGNRRHWDTSGRLTDVLKFSQETNLAKKYEHPTRKPETLTRALIIATTRFSDVVLAQFCGSGTEVAMAAKEGRQYIGFETERKWWKTSKDRVKEHTQNRQMSLLEQI